MKLIALTGGTITVDIDMSHDLAGMEIQRLVSRGWTPTVLVSICCECCAILGVRPGSGLSHGLCDTCAQDVLRAMGREKPADEPADSEDSE